MARDFDLNDTRVQRVLQNCENAETLQSDKNHFKIISRFLPQTIIIIIVKFKALDMITVIG